MTLLVLFIIGTAWALALLPPWLRNRRAGRPNDSILSFHRQLSTLQRATPAGRGATGVVRSGVMSRAAARRRRRDILSTLAAATGMTFVIALVLEGVAFVAFLVAVAMLVSYTAMLILAHKRSAGRGATVRYLAPPQARPKPVLLRRSASG